MENPNQILSPHLREGMTVLEPGPGMGFFTLELARMVGPRGRVIAVDIQPRMLAGLRRRATRAGLAPRIECRLGGATLGVGDLASSVDFLLAYAVVHELPDASVFFQEAAEALRPGGTLLFAEPSGPVDEKLFAVELGAAHAAGLVMEESLSLSRSQGAVLRKGNRWRKTSP
ncbi:MAG TPA: methyltransferase domain-containing protein [Spirochaetia bacterium]|nr:methyltransferase domain-containing protein [Spirochaetia bacterium]